MTERPSDHSPPNPEREPDAFTEEEAIAGAPVSDPESKSADRIVKGSASIGGIAFLTYVAAFLWKPVIAAFLGAGVTADAFNLAVLLVNRIYKAWEKLIWPSFLPTLSSERSEHGEAGGWRFASSLISLQFLLLVGLATVGIVTPEFWTRLVIEGGDLFDFDFAGFRQPESGLWILDARLNVMQREVSRLLIRGMSVALIFLGLSSTTYQLLNSYKRFSFAHLGELANKLGQVLGLVLFYMWLGLPGLIMAFVLGSVFKLGCHLVGLGRKLKNLRPAFDWTSPAMRRMAILIVPLLLGVVFAFVRDIVEYRLRSGFLGAMSIVTYGRTLGDVAIQIIPFALGIALFPFISEYAARKEDKRLFGLLWTAIRFVLTIFVPISAFMIVFRVPLIQFVFERGEFMDNPTNLPITANTSAWYALGMVGFAAEIILGQFFFAKKNTLIPTVLGICTSILLLILMYTGTRPGYLFTMAEPEYGFTMAHTVAKSLKSAILVGLLVLIFPRIGMWGSELGRTLWSFVRILVAVAAACVASLLVAWLVMGATPWAIVFRGAPIPYRFDSTLLTMLVKFACLLAIGVPGLVAYLGALAALRVPEFRLTYDWVRDKIGRRLGR